MKTPTLFLCMTMLAASVAIAGCDGGGSEDTPSVTAALTVNPSTLSFDGSGGSATVTVTATDKWKVSGDADWLSLSNTSGPASSGGYNVTVKAEENDGETRTATVTFVLGDNVKTATVSVSQEKKDEQEPEPAAEKGTAGNPYTASEARTLIMTNQNTDDSVYVAGIISQISEVSPNYGNATFFITEDGVSSNTQFEIYRCHYLGNENFTSADQIALGDTVTVYGVLVYYNNSTPEMTSGGYITVHKPAEKTAETDGHPLEVAPSWMELPQTSNGDYKLFTHDMTIKNAVERNYTFYWDYTDRLSVWVAYPLNEGLRLGGTSGCGRSDAWGYDPLLPAADQQNVSSGYKKEDGTSYNGAYARGHQIPSYDRQSGYAANAMTFYGTNMTPQYSNFNGGIWMDLEGQVRTWAKDCDTLYVLTGCSVDGADRCVYDASGNQITMPSAYFKALLRYKASDAEPYSATAFWFDHYGYIDGSLSAGGSISSGYAISVAELEEKLGYKLFVNLDAEVGADKAAEIRSEANWW